MRVGLISNAQFYTPELFPALFERTAEEFGLVPGVAVLLVPSMAAAKPGLHDCTWPPADRLPAGYPARRDAVRGQRHAQRRRLRGPARLPDRAVRRRSAQPALDGTSGRRRRSPDLMLTDLAQIAACVSRGSAANRDGDRPWHDSLWGRLSPVAVTFRLRRMSGRCCFRSISASSRLDSPAPTACRWKAPSGRRCSGISVPSATGTPASSIATRPCSMTGPGSLL